MYLADQYQKNKKADRNDHLSEYEKILFWFNKACELLVTSYFWESEVNYIKELLSLGKNYTYYDLIRYNDDNSKYKYELPENITISTLMKYCKLNQFIIKINKPNHELNKSYLILRIYQKYDPLEKQLFDDGVELCISFETGNKSMCTIL